MFSMQIFRVLPVKRVILLMILMVLLLLVVTGLLFPEPVRGLLARRQSSQTASIGSVPTLALSASPVKAGQMVKVHIVHFTPATHVLVTHDVGIAVQTDKGSSTVNVGPDGTADIVIHIDKSWQPGAHMIGAEDVATHYTASVAIQVAA